MREREQITEGKEAKTNKNNTEMKTAEIRGRCYDHNFLRFSTIFGEKIGVFLKKTML
jgi:hypothetical protein